jgi:threonine dehydrogenase-like Zn-dependent dehydrogenase
MTGNTTLVVRAEKKPLEGVAHPGPNQLFRQPHLTIENRPLAPLQAGYIRVEMLYAGICGTDVHVMQTNPATGYTIGTAPLDIGPEGRVLGHEGVGKVLEVGTGVVNVQPGKYVTFESIITCHYCSACRRGDFNQCEQAILFGMEHDGLFGTTVDVPAGLAHDVTDLAAMDGGLQAAACVEPAACGYVAASLTKVSPGDSVLIFGAGPIGLLTAMLCKHCFGAAEIHVVEPVPFRREFAMKWADRVYDVEEFFAAELKHPIDVIIEASGVVDNVNRAFRKLAANGRIALLARSGKPLAIQHVDYMITNSISIVGSRGHLGGAFQDILQLYRARRIPLHEAVTDTINGIEALKQSLENPATILDSNCKVLVKLSSQ